MPWNDNKLHDHYQDDHEGLECTLVGHLEEIGCLKEYILSSFGRHYLSQFLSDSKVTDLFGKEITLATTFWTDFD